MNARAKFYSEVSTILKRGSRQGTPSPDGACVGEVLVRGASHFSSKMEVSGTAASRTHSLLDFCSLTLLLTGAESIS